MVLSHLYQRVQLKPRYLVVAAPFLNFLGMLQDLKVFYQFYHYDLYLLLYLVRVLLFVVSLECMPKKELLDHLDLAFQLKLLKRVILIHLDKACCALFCTLYVLHIYIN